MSRFGGGIGGIGRPGELKACSGAGAFAEHDRRGRRVVVSILGCCEYVRGGRAASAGWAKVRARGRRGREASKTESVGFLKISCVGGGAPYRRRLRRARAVVVRGGEPGSCAGIYLPWSPAHSTQFPPGR